MNALLRWWLMACLYVTGFVVMGMLGTYEYLWEIDQTKLSFVVIVMFVGVTIFIGLLTYHARNGDQLFVRHLSLCYYLAEKMMALGMIGTLIGFLLLLNGVFGGSINLADASAAQKVLGLMAKGFATSSVTTVVGLIAAVSVKGQLVNLEYLAEENAA
jgi:hypothetical protein